MAGGEGTRYGNGMTPLATPRCNDTPTTEDRRPAAVQAEVRLTVTQPFPVSVLALGGELKNTICRGEGTHATVSGPRGDLSESANYRRFVEGVECATTELGRAAFVVGHDLHPTYLSTAYAQRLAAPKFAVQHHHAHAVSCATDAGMALPVVGIVCDGTGYGTDGAIWGGEVLLCQAASFRRLAHLDYFALPGGDAAARWTWRPALSLLRLALPDSKGMPDLPAFRAVDAKQRAIVDQQLAVGLNTPSTSSLGRLFDAVAFLTGVCGQNDEEGQAARALQAASAEGWVEPYPYALGEGTDRLRLSWQPMIRAIVADVQAGIPASLIATRFHETVAAMFAAAALRGAQETGVERVVLSGGCFLNDRLRDGVRGRLAQRGLEVGVHTRVSPGDAGLSLGQAVVASATAARED
jgi:hydrogenase maturation protein HypF